MRTTFVDQMRTLRRLVEERTAANRGKRPTNKTLAEYISSHCSISWLPSNKVLEYNVGLAATLDSTVLDELDQWAQVL